MNGGPSGFNNAPVARTFLIACGFFTIIFGIQGRSNKLGLSYQDIFKKLQLWKLVVSIFAFSSTPELIFGLYLLYYFRVFERQIGSNKYSVFVLFSIIVSLLLEVLALAFLKDPTLNGLTSGPYGVIFSSFVPFLLDIPVSTRFRVFGLRFSDKSFIYLAGLQLLLSSWKRSILPGICGILAGFCYRLNVLHIRRLKFPDFIASFFSRFSLPSTGNTVPAAPSRSVPRNISPPYTGRQAEEWLQNLCNSRLDSIYDLKKREITRLPRLQPWSHQRILLLHWFQWVLTGILPGRRLCMPETMLMQPPTSFLKHSRTKRGRRKKISGFGIKGRSVLIPGNSC